MHQIESYTIQVYSVIGDNLPLGRRRKGEETKNLQVCQSFKTLRCRFSMVSRDLCSYVM